MQVTVLDWELKLGLGLKSGWSGLQMGLGEEGIGNVHYFLGRGFSFVVSDNLETFTQSEKRKFLFGKVSPYTPIPHYPHTPKHTPSRRNNQDQE